VIPGTGIVLKLRDLYFHQNIISVVTELATSEISLVVLSGRNDQID